MTRVTPNPGQIAQIQTTGVAAQQIGQVRPGSPPPPDLSRLNRFANLSQSVTRFLDAYGDNDRLKSRKDAEAAFAAAPQELRDKLTSGDPTERLGAVDEYLDRLVRSGEIRKADHPRFRNHFRVQAGRAELTELATNLNNRIATDAGRIYDGEGSLAPEIAAGQVLAEEMEKLQGSLALQDPFVARQLGGEILEIQSRFTSAYGNAQAQAMEEAARGQVKNQVLEFAQSLTANEESQAGDIVDADMTPLLGIMDEARKGYDMDDVRRIVVAGFQTEIGILLSRDKPVMAEAMLEKLASLRDSSKNLLIRDADTLELISGLREKIGKDIEEQENRERSEEEYERQKALRDHRNWIYSDFATGSREGLSPGEIAQRIYMKIHDIQNVPVELRGELLEISATLEDKYKSRDRVDDSSRYDELQGVLAAGIPTEQARDLVDAEWEAGNIGGDHYAALRDKIDSRASWEGLLSSDGLRDRDTLGTLFDFEDAPGSRRRDLLNMGSDKLAEHARLLDRIYKQNADKPPGEIAAALDQASDEFNQKARAEAREIQLEIEEEQAQAQAAFDLKITQGTATMADMAAAMKVLPPSRQQQLIYGLERMGAKNQDIRNKTLYPALNQIDDIARRLLNEVPGDFVEENRILRTADFAKNLVREEFDRITVEVYPNAEPQQRETLGRKTIEEFIREKVIPQMDEQEAFLFQQIEAGADAGEAVEEARARFGSGVGIEVDVAQYPELAPVVQLSGTDLDKARREARRVLTKASPQRQEEMLGEIAPLLGIKFDEVLNGRIFIQTGRERREPGSSEFIDVGVTIPTTSLAGNSQAKWNTPLFSSQEEFKAARQQPEKMAKLFELYGIKDEASQDAWMKKQADQIVRVHGIQ